MNRFKSNRVRMLALMAVGAVGVFFAGMYAARATPGGETRRGLSFAGTLRGTTGAQTLTFTFRKATTMVCAPTVNATPDAATGAFNVDIPLASCPTTLFDGSDVTFDVSVGPTVIVTAQPVSPVPYARYADQVGTPECPVGYSRDAAVATYVVCRRGNDEVVKVGEGPAAFWIDRYESSVWTNRDGTGTQYGAIAAPDFPSTFPVTGAATVPLYAVSRVGVIPSRNMTYFQAAAVCAASGKRLAHESEWYLAATGTPSLPVPDDGSSGVCKTAGTGARLTGSGTGCISLWGAQDMNGSLAEYSADLHSVGSPSFTSPPEFGSASSNNDRIIVLMLGGAATFGQNGGIYAIQGGNQPYMAHAAGVARCLLPR